MVLLGSAVVIAIWSMSSGARGWLLANLGCGLVAVAVVADRGARAAASAVQVAVDGRRAVERTAVAKGMAAVKTSLHWSAEELCRGVRPPLPDPAAPQLSSPTAEIDAAFRELQAHAVEALIRVHDGSQSVVMLEVLRRLAQREHALVGDALHALTELERMTDDPALLAKSFKIDHLVTRVRRQIESTTVLAGQSLRSVRYPVPVTTVLRGASSEVLQYPRVSVVAGSVGVALGLPGHVGPDLTHLLAELIENALECSAPTTRVTVRAQRVPNGLAIEVEDRGLPIPPQIRAQINQALQAPDEVDVTGSVRAGQLGLVVVTKIAQKHGISVCLLENTAGGTTAQVVVPSRLFVEIAAVSAAAPRSDDGLPSAPSPPRGATAVPVPQPADVFAGSRTVATSGGCEPVRSSDAPALPTRPRRIGPAFRQAGEQGQPPSAAPAAPGPGLAAAFRSGLQAGTSAPPE
ncbi:sensor histidine kinase [Streptomyces sp. GF20]|uniref:sensor histidine kinase n=1 Tax=Streptomyces sp. GF20 TaxID=2692235 RepID=UPI002E29EC89|nr:ATP-binding protein [Streptomyces sp. GF20]